MGQGWRMIETLAPSQTGMFGEKGLTRFDFHVGEGFFDLKLLGTGEGFRGWNRL